MRSYLFFVLAAAFASVFAQPELPLESVHLEVDAGIVTTRYRLLGEDAIVTVLFRTNGVPIAGAECRSLQGDVNRHVGPGDHTFVWNAKRDMPRCEQRGQEGVTVELTAWSLQDPPNLMVVDLETPGVVSYYVSDRDLPEGSLTNNAYRTVKMAFRRIRSGHEFWRMGSPVTESTYYGVANEMLHGVTLIEDFYLGVYEVTGCQYGILCGGPKDLSGLSGAKAREYLEIRGAHWPDVSAPTPSSNLGRLRSHAGGGDFDLPLEAQWEYACRAGARGEIPLSKDGEGSTYVPERAAAAVYGSAGNVSMPVGSRLPNAFGLYDMIGGCCEWCRDWYAEDVSGVNPEVGPLTGSTHVYRSSAYHWHESSVRCATRKTDGNVWNDMVGYRIACPVGRQP